MVRRSRTRRKIVFKSLYLIKHGLPLPLLPSPPPLHLHRSISKLLRIYLLSNLVRSKVKAIRKGVQVCSDFINQKFSEKPKTGKMYARFFVACEGEGEDEEKKRIKVRGGFVKKSLKTHYVTRKLAISCSPSLLQDF